MASWRSIGLVVAVLFSCVTGGNFSQLPAGIIFILADDMGYTDVGVYFDAYLDSTDGDLRRPLTPAIDALASAGIRLDNFRVMSPVCTPSRVSFMTGMLPTAAGFPNYADCKNCEATAYNSNWYKDSNGDYRQDRHHCLPRLDENWENVYKVASRAGYRTAHFGKWHVGCHKMPGPEAYGVADALAFCARNHMASVCRAR